MSHRMVQRTSHLSPGILFIADVPLACGTADIVQVFRNFGPLVNVFIKEDELLRFAYVVFESVTSALQAICDLENTYFFGQPLR